MDEHERADGPSTLRSRRRLLATTATLGVGVLAGCTGAGDSGDGSSDDGAGSGSDPDSGSNGDGDAMSWRSIELTTVRGEESFSIGGLDGPVVIQSFAVWCPKCQQQSEELAKLGDSATVVGLNTDPNEDAEKVRQHAESNGFDWRFAVAPTGMTDSLIDQFGTTVTNAPSTPVIVACEGNAEFLSGEINPADEVATFAENC
jgi:thiol-disulfide isomerase/thioredoxin